MDVIAELNAGLHGRYTIEREIGAGGMATVFLARDLRHERRVALKVLEPELGAVLGAERFLSEIASRRASSIRIPAAVRFGRSRRPALLRDALRRGRDAARGGSTARSSCPVDEAVHIAVAICGALDYAHRHGVVHRDLKPENILLHDGQPLIADFGIALAISSADVYSAGALTYEMLAGLAFA